jgi:hypothetical protein
MGYQKKLREIKRKCPEVINFHWEGGFSPKNGLFGTDAKKKMS